MAGLIDDWPEAAGTLARDDSGDSVPGDGGRPDATALKGISSDQRVAAMQKDLVNERRCPPGGVLDVWQGKDL